MNVETDRYEGIDPLTAYHLRSILVSLSALGTDTDVSNIKGVMLVLSQAETATFTALALIREQAKRGKD